MPGRRGGEGVCYPDGVKKEEGNLKERKGNRMALAQEAKNELISKYRQHKTDTGSPEVQIALLTQNIAQLTEHFKIHKKDHHSRRGLLTLVARRRKLLDYLKRKSPERYKGLIVSLGLRR